MLSRRFSPVAARAAASSRMDTIFAMADVCITGKCGRLKGRRHAASSCAHGQEKQGNLMALSPSLPLSLSSVSVLCAVWEEKGASNDTVVAIRPCVRDDSLVHTVPPPWRTNNLAFPWTMSPSLGREGILALELMLVWASFSPIFPLLTA